MTSPATHRRLRRRLGRAWNIFTTVVLVAVAAIALLLVGLPLALGAETHTVLTGSMRPGIEPGAIIAVRDTPADELRVGDVVTYQVTSGRPELVTHRIISIEVGAGGVASIVTQGDANSAVDPPIVPEQIRGVVVYVVPWVGYLNLLVDGVTRSSAVIVLGIAVIAYGVFILVRDVVRHRRGRRAAAAAVVTILAGALSFGTATPAQALTPTSPLQISRDGVTWVSAEPVALFPDGAVLAPGELSVDGLWVRNASDDLAEVRLVFQWSAGGTGDRSDQLAAAGVVVRADGADLANGERWSGGILAPDDSRRIDVGLGLAADTSNDSKTGSIDVSAAVVLSEFIPSGRVVPSGPLPATGAALPLGIAAAGVVILLLGVVTVRRGRRA